MATTLVAPESVERGPRPLTIEEFERLSDNPFPRGKRVELIEGQIYAKMGQSDSHITALSAVFVALQDAFGKEFHLRMQAPLKLGDESKPEPGVTVLRGAWRELRRTTSRP